MNNQNLLTLSWIYCCSDLLGLNIYLLTIQLLYGNLISAVYITRNTTFHLLVQDFLRSWRAIITHSSEAVYFFGAFVVNYFHLCRIRV